MIISICLRNLLKISRCKATSSLIEEYCFFNLIVGWLLERQRLFLVSNIFLILQYCMSRIHVLFPCVISNGIFLVHMYVPCAWGFLYIIYYIYNFKPPLIGTYYIYFRFINILCSSKSNKFLFYILLSCTSSFISFYIEIHQLYSYTKKVYKFC